MTADLAAMKVAWDAARKTAAVANAAESKAQQAYQSALSAAFRLQPGDIVRNAKGDEAKVKHLEPSVFSRRVGVTVVLRRKDGSWGNRLVPAWRGKWDDAELIERPVPELALGGARSA